MKQLLYVLLLLNASYCFAIEKARSSFYYYTPDSNRQVDRSTFLSDIQLVNPELSFGIKSENTDELKYRHTRYDVKFRNYPVFGDFLIVHEKDGQVQTANGRISRMKGFEAFSVGEQAAQKAAVDLARVKWNVKELQPGAVQGARMLYYAVGDSLVPVYEIEVSAGPGKASRMYISGVSLRLVDDISLVHNGTNTTAVLPTYYQGNKTANVEATGKSSNPYALNDVVRNIKTRYSTYDTTSYIYDNDNNWAGRWFFDSVIISAATTSTVVGIKIGFNVFYNHLGNSWAINKLRFDNDSLQISVKGFFDSTFATANTVIPKQAVYNTVLYYKGVAFNLTFLQHYIQGYEYDVHWGLQKTYDYYLSKFNQRSFDNNNAPINAYCNTSNNLNAYWQGGNVRQMAFFNWDSATVPQDISFGPGISRLVKFGPCASIDVVGHEFTHAVTEFSAALIYSNESGALNEGFSDILGEMVERDVTGSNDWKCGAAVFFGKDALRNFANPKLYNSPDTYGGQYWKSTNDVHYNSAILNYWFYIMVTGKSGVNDLGNAYQVTGIGADKAIDIAYNTLKNFLGPSSTYLDCYRSSVQYATNKYGITSAERKAVQDAWFAVGVAPNSGTLLCYSEAFTAPSGSFDDGSGSGNYISNTNCTWSIAPKGAQSIQIKFSDFMTENNFDTVTVYQVGTNTSTRLGVYSGDIPDFSINVNSGKAVIVFKSDNGVEQPGFNVSYTSTGTPTCDGRKLLTENIGSFGDGSGPGAKYGNNQNCEWVIAPPCAGSITLSFDSFQLEGMNFDKLEITDGAEPFENVLATYSGFTLPAAVTSPTEKMVVRFNSLYSNTYAGFQVHYNATGQPTCGNTSFTGNYGTIEDGSGSGDYCNNMSCTWLIKPVNGGRISLSFVQLQLYSSPTESILERDKIILYDGEDTLANVLQEIIPGTQASAIISTGNAMLVRFVTGEKGVAQGWRAMYTTVWPNGVVEGEELPFTIVAHSGEMAITSKMAGTYELISTDGRAVLKSELESGTKTISTAGIATGIYMLKCRSQNGVVGTNRVWIR